MTWHGESGDSGSGLYTYTNDGSPGVLVGVENHLLAWNYGLPVFVEQASITGVNPAFLNQIGDVDVSVPVSGQFFKWNGLIWIADTLPEPPGATRVSVTFGPGLIETTSQTPVLVPGLTVTPGAGDFLIMTGMSLTTNASGRTASLGIYIDGVLQEGTLRTMGNLAFNLGNGFSSIIATLTAGQVVEVRWAISNNALGEGALSPGSRILSAIKIS